jgi:hypothetical protein
MSKRLVLENEFAHLGFHPEPGIVHHQFHKLIGPMNLERIAAATPPGVEIRTFDDSAPARAGLHSVP